MTFASLGSPQHLTVASHACLNKRLKSAPPGPAVCPEQQVAAGEGYRHLAYRYALSGPRLCSDWLPPYQHQHQATLPAPVRTLCSDDRHSAAYEEVGQVTDFNVIADRQ